MTLLTLMVFPFLLFLALFFVLTEQTHAIYSIEHHTIPKKLVQIEMYTSPPTSLPIPQQWQYNNLSNANVAHITQLPVITDGNILNAIFNKTQDSVV